MHHTGVALARQGFVVLCADALCFEERVSPLRNPPAVASFNVTHTVYYGSHCSRPSETDCLWLQGQPRKQEDHYAAEAIAGASAAPEAFNDEGGLKTGEITASCPHTILINLI